MTIPGMKRNRILTDIEQNWRNESVW